jgi:hypothetical protein
MLEALAVETGAIRRRVRQRGVERLGLGSQFAPLLIGLDWKGFCEQVLTRTVADADSGRSRHLCLRRSLKCR